MATLVSGGIAVILTTAVTIGFVHGVETPAPDAPVPAAPTVEAVHGFTKQLDQEFAIDFAESDLVDVLSFARQISGLNIVVDPKVMAAGTPPVTVKVEKMPLRHVLNYIGRLTNTAIVIDHGALFCTPVIGNGMGSFSDTVIAAVAPAPSPLDAALNKSVSFDFQDAAIEDVIAFVGKISGLSVILTPTVNASTNPLTLTVSDMSLRDALYWVGKLSQTAFVNDGKTIVGTPGEIGGF